MINLIFPIKVTIRSQVPTGPISFFFGPHKTQLSGTLAPHYAYLDNLGGLQIQRFLSSFLSSPSLSLSLFFFFFWFVYLVCALYYGTSWEVNQAFTTDVSIVVLCSFRLKQNIKIWVCLSPSNMCSSIIVHSKPK